jgi:hypothetical protein
MVIFRVALVTGRLARESYDQLTLAQCTVLRWPRIMTLDNGEAAATASQDALIAAARDEPGRVVTEPQYVDRQSVHRESEREQIRKATSGGAEALAARQKAVREATMLAQWKTACSSWGLRGRSLSPVLGPLHLRDDVASPGMIGVCF